MMQSFAEPDLPVANKEKVRESQIEKVIYGFVQQASCSLNTGQNCGASDSHLVNHVVAYLSYDGRIS